MTILRVLLLVIAAFFLAGATDDFSNDPSPPPQHAEKIAADAKAGAIAAIVTLLSDDSAAPPPPPMFSVSNTVFPIVPGTTHVYVIEALDLDFNGTPDIVLSGPKSDSGGFVNEAVNLHVFVNTSTSTTTAFVYDFIPGSLVHPRAAVAADFNGDTVVDLAIADHGFDVMPFPFHANLLLLSDPSGQLIDAAAPSFDYLDFSHDITAGDYDNDGDIDIVISDLTMSTDMYLRFLANDGSGTFATAFPPDNGGLEAFTAAVLADVNIDGNLDLVLGSIGSSTTSVVVLGDGAGNFDFDNAEVLPDVPTFPIVPEILAADVNSDGFVDLVFSRTQEVPFYEGRFIQFLINDGAGNFTEMPLLPNQDLADKWTTEIYFADIDGDGLRDIILRVDAGFPNQSVFTQASDGTFSPITLPLRGGMFPVDVDNDGDLDLLVYTNTSSALEVTLVTNNL